MIELIYIYIYMVCVALSLVICYGVCRLFTGYLLTVQSFVLFMGACIEQPSKENAFDPFFFLFFFHSLLLSPLRSLQFSMYVTFRVERST